MGAGRKKRAGAEDAARAGAASSAGEKAKRRQIGRRDTEETADRLIKDRFVGLSPFQTDVKEIEGQTLRQRLLDDIRAKRAEGGQRPATQSYVASLRALYAGEDSLASKLVVKNPNEQVSEAFRYALNQAYHPNPGKRTKNVLYSFFSATMSLCQREMVGLLKSLGEMTSLASVAHRAHVLVVMRFLVSKDLHVTYKEECEAMKDLWDECLSMTYASERKDGDTKKFWASHSDVSALVLSVSEVETLLGAKGQWRDHRSTLLKVIRGSKLGAKLFSAAASAVLMEEFSVFVDTEITVLRANRAPLTKQLITDLKAKLLAHGETLGGKVSGRALAGRRDIVVRYRSAEVPCSVLDHIEEIDVKIGAFVKEAALGRANGLTPLAWESHCFGHPKHAEKIASDIPGMKDYEAARVVANEAFQAAGAKTGSDFAEVMAKKAAVLRQLDRSSSVEAGALKVMLEGQGQKVLQEKVLDAMPSATAERSIQQTVEDIMAVQSSELYKFVQPSTRAAVDGAKDFLQSMEAGECAKVHDIPSEGFMRQVLQRTEFFACWRPAAQEGKPPGSPVFGKTALEKIMADLQKASTSEKGIKINDLAVPSMLRHLLPTKLKVLLDELTDEVVKKAMITPAGSASSSGSAKKGRGQGNTLPRKKAKIEAKESEERVQNMITDWFN